MNKEKGKRILKALPAHILVGLWSVFTIVVIGWIVLASFSTTKEIFTDKLLHSGFHIENYIKALFANDALLNLVNSVIYTVPSCILIILFSAPAAYALQRYVFRGNRFLQKLMVIGMGIHSVMIIMPLISVVNAIGMTNSRLTLIILYTATSIPFTTYFLMSYYNNISVTYEEAAAIDGCGPIRTFWSIIFPLIQPAIVTVTIFNFIGKWNEYFMALVFANDKKLKSIGVGLYSTIQSMVTTGDYAGMFASVVIVFMPTLLIYIFMADKIVSGVSQGGLKG